MKSLRTQMNEYTMLPEKSLNLEKELSQIEQKFQSLDFSYIEREIIQTIPKEWEVDRDVRYALYHFIKGRAEFLTQHFKALLSNVLSS
jgi:hypothetical protein